MYSSGLSPHNRQPTIGLAILGDLASHFDHELAQQCYANHTSAEQAILTHLYNPETHKFEHRWQGKDGRWQRYPVKTVQTLFPLLLSSLPAEALVAIVELLRNENEFGTRFMVPTVSKAEPQYNPVANTLLLWRGPIWGFTNWFIMEGLEKHAQRHFHIYERIANQIQGRLAENYGQMD